MLRTVNIVLVVRFNRVFTPDDLKPFDVDLMKKFKSAMLNFGSKRIHLFFSGKAIVTGVRSVDRAMCLLNKFLNKLEQEAKLVDWEVVNVTGSFSLPFKVKTICLCKHPKITYYPEIFQAMYYTEKDSKLTIIIFHTGKAIITGAKSPNEMRLAYRNFMKDIRGFMKKQGGYISPENSAEAPKNESVVGI